MAINLTSVESNIFSILLGVLKEFQLSTTLRVAGGWVRDKLLGRENLDIDIALDNMLGREFAEHVNRYLVKQGLTTRGIGVIQSNPEQSKHLETARIHLNSMWIDLTNLRCETYAEDSRIPEMTFGTPKEDAFRRDLTINSLFYNINEERVEDLTGQGLADLDAGIIRTPLPPLTTFLDDPLRVLRAIRFASRFGFALDDKLVEAAQDATVKAALLNKVSRERVGIEVDGMLKGPRPVMAISLMETFGLLDVVFKVPENADKVPDAYANRQSQASRFAGRFLSLSRSRAAEHIDLDGRLFFLAAILAPLHRVYYKDAKKKMQPATLYVIRESLKLKTKDADNVQSILDGAAAFEQLAHSVASEQGQPLSRKKAGLIVREAGPLWSLAVGVAAVTDAMTRCAKPLPDVPIHVVDHSQPTEDDEDSAIFDRYLALHRSVVELGLVGVWDMKPLIDGKVLLSEYKLKPGKELGLLITQEIEWQLEHPDATLDACKQWLTTVLETKSMAKSAVQ